MESGAYDREGRAEFMKIHRALWGAWEKRRFLFSDKQADGFSNDPSAIPKTGNRAAHRS